MTEPSLQLLKTTVLFLSLFAVALALVVYLLMDVRYRHQLARDARRLILSSRLFPNLKTEELRKLWSRSGHRDREIVEDIVADLSRSASGSAGPVEQAAIEVGIMDRWIEDLTRGGTSEKIRAAKHLGSVHDARGVEALNRALEDRSPEVRLAATVSLGRLKDPKGLTGLKRVASLLSSAMPDLTLAAALAECAKGYPREIMNLLHASEARTRVIGAWAVSEVADRTVLQKLLIASRDPDPEVRAKVARALARIPGPESAEALCRLAKDPIWFVRVRALDALGRLQETSGWAAAVLALEDEVREVRYRAAFALRQIQGMKGDIAVKILSTCPRASFDSLISEWERAGFLWQVVGGLSTRDWSQFLESREVVRMLVAAGVTRALVHFVLVYPDIKVRLRLLRHLIEAPDSNLGPELLKLAGQPRCDPRVAAAIRRAFPRAGAPSVAGVEPATA